MRPNHLRRREFITLLGGLAAAWPLAARAQQPAMPVIGFVRITTPEESVPFVAAFRRGLGESGYVEGQNVAIEARYAFNQVDRLPALMVELVNRRVAVLATTGGTILARAPPKQRPRRFRLSSRPGMIRSGLALSPASISPAATSPV
jgi:putative tryptophan/tyrosine transport system substrate-binding protein